MLFQPFASGSITPLISNFGGDSVSDTTIGVAVTPGAANVKGSTTGLLTGANLSRDVYGIGIVIAGGATAATIRRYLVDIMYDPAGGTAWTVLIPNLLANSPSMSQGGAAYYFPLAIPSGSAIGARCQSNVATAIRVGVQVYSGPSRPEAYRWGTYVEAFGAVTASTSGTAVTPGTNLLGSYASMGTTTKDLWWWQWGGMAFNDTTLTVLSYFGDVAVGDATFKETAISRCLYTQNANEQCGVAPFGIGSCSFPTVAGTTVYVRVGGTATADTTPTTMAYGMG